MKLNLLLFVSLLIPLGFAHADVDLDMEMQRNSAPQYLTVPQTLKERPPLDLSTGFPGIADQGPLGGCQSFAMAAWLDYLFYFKTGHVIDISEKQLAYNLLSFMTDEFWDKNAQSYPATYLGQNFFPIRPYLGSGVAPIMLAAYFKGYAIPDSIYSFGNLSSKEGPVGLDFETFNKYFGDTATVLKRDDYLANLPIAFLSAPPQNFVYELSGVNFSNGAAETLTLKAPKDLADLIGLDPSNVTSYYNLDYAGYKDSLNQANAHDLMNYWVSISQHFGQRGQALASESLLKVLKQSLDQRMAVMIAADVWKGAWTDGVLMSQGGGHAMVVVGYQDRSDGYTYFKLRNSWGADRLVQGYNYVRSDILMANTFYIVVHEPNQAEASGH